MGRGRSARGPRPRFRRRAVGPSRNASMAPAGCSSWWWSGSENLRVRRGGRAAGGVSGVGSSAGWGMPVKDSPAAPGAGRMARRGGSAGGGQPLHAGRGELRFEALRARLEGGEMLDERLAGGLGRGIEAGQLEDAPVPQDRHQDLVAMDADVVDAG